MLKQRSIELLFWESFSSMWIPDELYSNSIRGERKCYGYTWLLFDRHKPQQTSYNVYCVCSTCWSHQFLSMCDMMFDISGGTTYKATTEEESLMPSNQTSVSTSSTFSKFFLQGALFVFKIDKTLYD